MHKITAKVFLGRRARYGKGARLLLKDRAPSSCRNCGSRCCRALPVWEAAAASRKNAARQHLESVGHAASVLSAQFQCAPARARVPGAPSKNTVLSGERPG